MSIVSSFSLSGPLGFRVLSGVYHEPYHSPAAGKLHQPPAKVLSLWFWSQAAKEGGWGAGGPNVLVFVGAEQERSYSSFQAALKRRRWSLLETTTEHQEGSKTQLKLPFFSCCCRWTTGSRLQVFAVCLTQAHFQYFKVMWMELWWGCVCRFMNASFTRRFPMPLFSNFSLFKFLTLAHTPPSPPRAHHSF